MVALRLLILGLTLAAVAAGPLTAQTIRGVVVDAATRGPVVGAVVELLSASGRDLARATTDELGRFAIAAPRADTYGLRVRHPAFLEFVADSVTVGTSDVAWIELRLGQATIPLEPVVVSVRRAPHLAEFEERRAIGHGYFMTRDDIRSRGAGRMSELMSNIPGVTFRRAGPSGSMLLMRNAGGVCQPAIWLDGVEIRQFPGSTVDDVIHPNTLDGIEVYTSHASAPTRYVTGPCGVVLFWTRRGSDLEGRPWQWKKFLAGAGAALILVLLIR